MAELKDLDLTESPRPAVGGGKRLVIPPRPENWRPGLIPLSPDPGHPFIDPVQDSATLEDELRTAVTLGARIEPMAVTVEDVLRTLQPYAYISGRAGTGKTTLARMIHEARQDTVLCSTTGIAAVNLGNATTLNALLWYFDTPSLQQNFRSGMLLNRLYKLRQAGLRIILVDEVSMLPAEQLSVLVQAIDQVNQGTGYDRSLSYQYGEGDDLQMRLLLVGDFAQLPPVEAPYAFEAPEWTVFSGSTLKLEKVWRQEDRDFAEALHMVRLGKPDAALPVLEKCFVSALDTNFEGTTIVAKNAMVDVINARRHATLPGTPILWKTVRSGEQQKDWTRLIPEEVSVKPGALVMTLMNRPCPSLMGDTVNTDYFYVNGDLGHVVEAAYEPGEDIQPGTPRRAVGVKVEILRTGETVTVIPHTKEWVEPLKDPVEVAEDYQAKPGENVQRVWDPASKTTKRLILKRVRGTVSYLPLRLAWATTVHKCVVPYTRVQTLQHGVVRIRDLRVGDLLPTGVVRAIVPTEQSAYRITTKLGYTVDCSADHRWMTEQGLRSTRELLIGTDRIQLAVGRPSGGRTFPVEDAYWLGLLVGDGNYTDRDDGTLHFSSVTDPELGDTFARGALRLGARTCSWRKDRRGLHTSCRALRRQLLAWGVEYVTAPHKTIPTVIWEADSGVWAAFLRGLYDADGSVGRSGVILTTASPQLAGEVQELLLLLGVVSRRQVYPGRKTPYYQVYIGARGLATFKALIGFAGIRKCRRLAETLPNRVVTGFEGFDTIAQVEKLDLLVPMIDVEVTAPHLLGFGPFVGHNSQGLSLDQVQVAINDWMFTRGGMMYVALSRCRTIEGLRIVGTPKLFMARCAVDPRVSKYL